MSLLIATTCISLVICFYYLRRLLANFCLRTTSSSQRVPASAPGWKYDVFLSFRGEETRKGIAFEIYDGLKNRGGIRTFMDDQELQVGAPISPSLLKAIEESRFAIVVLSPNYASSPWCLQELTKIVDCMEDENRILPLFYHVEPSDVRHQKNSFEVAFIKHEATRRHGRETVKQWRDALETVANFSGWETQKYKNERELVKAIVEYVCNKVQTVGYLADYKSSHQNLQTKLEDLAAARDEVQHRVDEVQRRGKRIETSVQNWMTRVDVIITEAETFLKDGRHAQTECLHGLCPNLELCNQLSKESAKLVEEIVQLYGKKEFSNFAYDVLPQEVCLLSTGHYTAFHSRNSIVMNVMDELRNPYTEMILVYGIAGVGKTTLVEQVLRQAKHDNLFDDVVMVRDVKHNPDLEKIQKEIATKLGLSIPENHTLAERAPKLGDSIKDRRTLVVLDDVWEQIDLLAIGLPRLVTCKLVLTCRSRRELSLDMRTQKGIPLNVLNEEEAWSLFEKMAGDVIKDSHIRSVAMEVAKKCGGLPVLIVTVARALKDRNKLHAWNDTLRRLSRFDKEELTKKAYLALEWSYNQLEEKELKPLFLLCGIIVVENDVYLEDLCKYGMGLCLFKNVKTIEQARDLLGTLVEKLTDSCLLLESDRNKYFRMHDLVCEVARRIASRDQHVLSVGYGGELKEWPDKGFFKRCSKMSLVSSNIPMLSKVPRECPKLEMFYLYDKASKSIEIHSNCFSEMEKLKVLGLIKLHMLSLPSSLQFLKNLQTLCLEQCTLGEIALVGHLSNLEILSFARSNIEQLPKEIGQLIRLRWLDLSDCDDLEVISPDVISGLEKLEVLTMRNSFHKWEAERGGSNASLLELKLLSQLTALEIYIPYAHILPTNLFSNKLIRYQIYIGWSRYSWGGTMAETTLNTLKLKLTTSNELDQGLKTLLKGCEDLSLDGTTSVNIIFYQSNIEDFQQLKHLHLRNNVDFTHMIDRKIVFPNLTTLSVHSCDCPSFLFSLSMAKSLVKLKHLKVSSCSFMEEIVSTRDQPNEKIIDNMFCKLESLTLDELPNLARFCTVRYIEFPAKKKFNTELGASMCDPRISIKLDVKSETAVQNYLFDAQVKFPSLEKLEVRGLRKLHTIWNNQLVDQDFFCKLREVDISHCDNLMNVFVPIFEIGGTDVKERHADTSSPHQLGPFYCQSIGSVTITWCKSLQKIFPATIARNLQKLYELRLERCNEVEEIIFGEEGPETMPPQFVFPKVISVTFAHMPKLSSFYPGMHTSKLPLLTNLYVYECDKVKLFVAELPIFRKKYEMDPLIEQSLFLIDKVVFHNLTTLSVHSCGSLRFLFSFSMAKSLVKLKHLKVSSCEIMEEIISTRDESNEETIDNIVFCKLESLTLAELPNLGRFCTGSYIEFLPKKKFNTELGVSSCDPRISQKLDVMGETPVQNCLFDAKVKFPSLEKLEVRGLRKLHTIWKPCNALADQDSFCRLRDVDISNCHSLMSVFVPIMMGRLNALETLRIMYCNSLEVVLEVGGTDVEEGLEIMLPLFVFPKVTTVIFNNMPKLSRFYPGMYVSRWPLLKDLYVYKCDEVKIFAAELPIFRERHEVDLLTKQSLFLIDKDSFPNLEHLILGIVEIWYGPSPAHFFSKLKSIRFRRYAPFSKQSALFLHKLQNLDTLEVWSNDSEEIFVNEEMNSGGEMEIHADAVGILTLPRVKHLELLYLQKLLHLGNHNSQSAGPLFPNLDTLHVYECGKLKNVESSAISFRNLTSLTVVQCGGLEYIASYSVAKSLMQLTTLQVGHCSRLREIIVASNEDDHCEIAFSRLKLLSLWGLPSLQGFCSRNCTVKLTSSTELNVCDCGIELKISSQDPSSQGVLLSTL